MKKELTDEDKIYVICWNLGIKHDLWDIQDEKTKREVVKRELWIEENAKVIKLIIKYDLRFSLKSK